MLTDSKYGSIKLKSPMAVKETVKSEDWLL